MALLLRWIEVAEAFTFVPVKIQSYRALQAVVRTARKRFGPEQIGVVDCGETPPEQVPLKLVAAAQGKRAVFAGPFGEDPGPRFARLNEQREAISAQMNCALILCLAGDELLHFIDTAPDFWSIRSTFLTLGQAVPIGGGNLLTEEEQWESPETYADQLRRLEGLTGSEVAARRARLYLLQGQSLASRLQPGQARRAFLNARDLALGLDDRTLAARAQLLSGQAFLQEFRCAEAEDALTEALSEFRRLGDRRGEARSYRVLGQAAWYQGRYSDAQSLLNRALRINRETGDRRSELVTLVALGEALASDGLLDRAHTVTSGALRLAEDLDSGRGSVAENARVLLSQLARQRENHLEAPSGSDSDSTLGPT